MGLEVTAFTTSFEREKEILELGASRLSHSTNLEILSTEKGKYDIIVNTLFITNDELITVKLLYYLNTKFACRHIKNCLVLMGL